MTEREIYRRLAQHEQTERIGKADRDYWRACFRMNAAAAELALSGANASAQKVTLTAEDERVLAAMQGVVSREQFIAERSKELARI